MDVLYETEVTPDQIDHLGHMNVMFYGLHARVGADRLLASMGVTEDDDQVVIQRDSIVRHLHEQLVGSPLAVRGGVLHAAPDQAVRLYQELVNTATDEVAATFVSRFEAADRRRREPMPLDPAALDAARRKLVTPPAERLPRTIDIDQDPTVPAPSLAHPPGAGPGHADPAAHRRGRRRRRRRGAVHQLAMLIWGGQAAPGREFQPLADLADGVQMGFATLESRATWARPARAGDQVQSFGAEIDLRAKTLVTAPLADGCRPR